MNSSLILLGVLCGIIGLVGAQSNAQTRVPRHLEECYRNATLYERDNRLPSTITTLIRLLRKIEDYPSLNMDMKDLAITLVHRFKQDGIERTRGFANSDFVLPYSPLGYQFAKFKILLTRLLPANSQTLNRFPNETLTMYEQCSLHFLLSNSIDSHVRGDEAYRCSSIAQYRTNRIPREASTEVEDIEFIEKHPKNLQQKPSTRYVEKLERDDYDTEIDEQIPTSRQYDFGIESTNQVISQCPVENGVIMTRWGTISPGTLIAGIAAGLEPQNVRVLDIIPLRADPGANDQFRRKNARQSATMTVDNRWAATLSGDLGEIALLQGPRPGDMQVGAKGVSLVFFFAFLSLITKNQHQVISYLKPNLRLDMKESLKGQIFDRLEQRCGQDFFPRGWGQVE